MTNGKVKKSSRLVCLRRSGMRNSIQSFSFFQVKMFTGSVRVLLTSVMKKKKKILKIIIIIIIIKVKRELARLLRRQIHKAAQCRRKLFPYLGSDVMVLYLQLVVRNWGILWKAITFLCGYLSLCGVVSS